MIGVAKTDVTKELEKLIWKHTKKMGVFGCFEVTLGWYGKERVDYLTYDTKGVFRCYEIKATKADFYSKAALSFVGHYNYFVMPEELYEDVKEDIPKHIGVYVSKGKYLISVKNAQRQKLGVEEDVLKDSLIRSLYRESEKVVSSDDELLVDRLRKQSSRYKSQAKRDSERYYELQNLIIQELGYDGYEKMTERRKKK